MPDHNDVQYDMILMQYILWTGYRLFPMLMGTYTHYDPLIIQFQLPEPPPLYQVHNKGWHKA
jgi:hypothetical protein